MKFPTKPLNIFHHTLSMFSHYLVVLLEISSSFQKWKNFEDRLRFEKVIAKSLVASFFGTQIITDRRLYTKQEKKYTHPRSQVNESDPKDMGGGVNVLFMPVASECRSHWQSISNGPLYCSTHCQNSAMRIDRKTNNIRYDTIEEFNVDSKAEYTALSSTRSHVIAFNQCFRGGGRRRRFH